MQIKNLAERLAATKLRTIVTREPRVNGIFLSDFERGEIGPDLFRHACMLGLEGLVSKRDDRPYRAGVSPHWVKVKNPSIPR
jgi:bifunctional non-homologous end joining protein LigD